VFDDLNFVPLIRIREVSEFDPTVYDTVYHTVDTVQNSFFILHIIPVVAVQSTSRSKLTQLGWNIPYRTQVVHVNGPPPLEALIAFRPCCWGPNLDL
jgi:hypothetical protein